MKQYILLFLVLLLISACTVENATSPIVPDSTPVKDNQVGKEIFTPPLNLEQTLEGWSEVDTTLDAILVKEVGESSLYYITQYRDQLNNAVDTHIEEKLSKEDFCQQTKEAGLNLIAFQEPAKNWRVNKELPMEGVLQSAVSAILPMVNAYLKSYDKIKSYCEDDDSKLRLYEVQDEMVKFMRDDEGTWRYQAKFNLDRLEAQLATEVEARKQAETVEKTEYEIGETITGDSYKATLKSVDKNYIHYVASFPRMGIFTAQEWNDIIDYQLEMDENRNLEPERYNLLYEELVKKYGSKLSVQNLKLMADIEVTDLSGKRVSTSGAAHKMISYFVEADQFRDELDTVSGTADFGKFSFSSGLREDTVKIVLSMDNCFNIRFPDATELELIEKGVKCPDTFVWTVDLRTLD